MTSVDWDAMLCDCWTGSYEVMGNLRDLVPKQTCELWHRQTIDEELYPEEKSDPVAAAKRITLWLNYIASGTENPSGVSGWPRRSSSICQGHCLDSVSPSPSSASCKAFCCLRAASAVRIKGMRRFSSRATIPGGTTRPGEKEWSSNSTIPSHTATLKAPTATNVTVLASTRTSMKLIAQGSRHGSFLPGIRIRVLREKVGSFRNQNTAARPVTITVLTMAGAKSMIIKSSLQDQSRRHFPFRRGGYST